MLTFSRNARSQLDSYAAELLTPSQRARTEITNYHAWFWQKVNQYRTSLDLPLEVELASQAQREADVTAVMEREGIRRALKDQRQVSDYGHALEYGLPNGRPDRLAEPRPSNVAITARLRELHRSTGRLHYDDLAYYMWLLLDGSRTLRHLWRHKYPVIVLDEYQDSSPLQAAIIERLTGQGSRVSRSPIRCNRSMSGAMHPSGGSTSSVRAEDPPSTPCARCIATATGRRFRHGCSKHATCCWTTPYP